ncbi:MAG TPA: adenylate cyclase regulatory domain-containing protein [Mycobacterium sp.]|nr:adenylate cyclase regulatory domain-containing protein [Mycobacterium sp.]
MADDTEQTRDTAASALISSGQLGGLEGHERRERAELVEWLLEQGFTADHIAHSLVPMLLPANRVLGDDGVYVSAREVAESIGIDLETLQRLQRAAGLPRIDDADSAVLPRADALAAARAKFLLDLGLDVADVVDIVKVLAVGLRRAAAMMRQPAFGLMVRPGATELEFAEVAETLARAAMPTLGPLVEGLLLLQLRHLFEEERISATERAAGRLPGARQVSVAFADLAGFTSLGETLPPEDLVRLARRLGDLALDIAEPPVWFIKTIGDAVMLVSAETTRLIGAVLELVDAATTNGLPQLRAGVADGLAVSRAGDWFGSPVNVASRVTALAPPGTVLVTESAQAAGDEDSGLTWSPFGAHRLRGVPEPVRLFRVSRPAS